MTASRFSETPEQTLARAFARHVLAWAKDGGAFADTVTDRAAACALLEEAAYRVSLAVSSGDACLPLEEMTVEPGGSDMETLRLTLLESGVVAPAGDPGNAPLVLDDGNRLYLHRYFDYEHMLAQRLAAMREVRPVDAARIRPLLDALFPYENGETVNWQKTAVALALAQPLLVVSGGPGTGKTTTVASLLACLLETDPQNRIMLAAPTGKAAMRMLDAISQRSAFFPLHMQPMVPKQAQTVHRLLGMSGDGATVRYYADNPLPLDTLIVDEASMLDLAMAARLFDAVPAHARVVLLGDKDQLAAVEAGSVFAELGSRRFFTGDCLATLETLTGLHPDTVPSSLSGRTPLENRVVWLTRNYRFSETSGIGKLAADIRSRRLADAADFLCSGHDRSVRWLDMADPAVMANFRKTLLDWYAPYFDSVLNGENDAGKIFDMFNRFRILCAVREGPCGVAAVNRLIARAMAEAVSGTGRGIDAAGSGWFAGRPVMIRRNDYSHGLFNGDVGIVLPDAPGRLAVWFMKEDGTFRTVSPSRLGEHETSFAMTVHQSQGSEFDSVALLLPAQFSRVLCRELVYTGITRAKTAITVMADRTILTQSLENDSVRRSGLGERLHEAWQNG